MLSTSKKILLPSLVTASLMLSSCVVIVSDEGKHVRVKLDTGTQNTQLGVAQLTESAAAQQWLKQGSQDIANSIVASKKINNEAGAAKNVILFIGDGMSLTTITTSRILQGQRQGQTGEESQLSFGAFPFTGLAKTYNVNAQTPDSAGTMTAIITGVKTDVGVVSVSEQQVDHSCASQKGNELTSALELAELVGKTTGVVSTARITHATPAATYAKAVNRDWEDDSEMTDEDKQNGCKDIALQLVEFKKNLQARFPEYSIDGLDVAFGGGKRHFLPKTENGIGKREDNRNLIQQWQQQNPNGQFVETKEQLAAVQSLPAMGLFNKSHLKYEAERIAKNSSEPSLTEMTSKAIDLLEGNEQGFLLVVESGRIDHGHHAGNAYNALGDTIELSKAVETALAKTDASETLIIVTADHGHAFSMLGYPRRGNPILGKVVTIGQDKIALAKDGKPYTTLNYVNGLGMKDYGDETNADVVYSDESGANTGREQDLTNVDTEAPGYHQQALIPLGGETHSGEDVIIYANGPGAHLISGEHEQTIIFHAINHAADLMPRD